MTDKKSNRSRSRRELLKAVAVGSGAVIAGKSLPESWSRPVVDSVILPAHAQTSQQGIYSSTVSRAGVPGAICVTALGNVADITLWFEFVPGSDLSIFQVSGVPIGPTSLTDMALISQTCGVADTCQVSCVTTNGTATGQFVLNSVGPDNYSAPTAACIPAPPATCNNSSPASRS